MRDTERFERRVELIRQSLDIPGMSVAVLHKQQVILARGFGVADVAKGTPATENTPYPIASLTKTFAATVIMRLVESGKLDLDEAIATRSRLRGMVTELKSRNLAPNFEYNGFLFARLTAVINSVSPKEFNRAVEDDILTPLGMKDTALGSQDPHKASVISRMPKPYKLDQDFNVVESATFRPPLDYISAASGLISTVMDLAKYDVAIDRDMVYSPGAKQQTWTAAKSPTGQRFPYGLGWFVWEPFTRFIWHYGWYPDAFSSLLFKIPDRELTLILLACTDRASSVFWLGNGDPLRSAFVTAFLDSFASDR